MKTKLNHIIKTKPVFLFLLPVFFVLHGFTENFDFVPVKYALLLTLFYSIAALVISLIFFLLYRHYRQAGLVAFLFMAYHFFFGSIHDMLKRNFAGTLITRYSFIIAASLLFFIVIITLIKKKKPALTKTTAYLNGLLLLLLVIDGFWLTSRVFNNHTAGSLPPGFTACDSCAKPDFYLIVTDEYAGSSELKDLFHFDNSEYINDLSRRGFYTIPYSHSNYNYTTFSVASILKMDYLDLKGKERSKSDVVYCYEQIRDNPLLRFLQYGQYRFYNYSFFDFKGQPARVKENLLPVNTRLITGQTFLSRIERDLGFNLITRLKSLSAKKKHFYGNKYNNENIIRLTETKASEKINSPKFVFSHLMIPHFPYYFDKTGKPFPFEQLVEGTQALDSNYIEYLQWGNKKILALIDHILQSSATPPVIIVMGDHGFRHFLKPVEMKYHFLDQVSVLLPSKNYKAFRDSLSCVNLLRSVLNTEFGQKLPYLKDSTIFLKE